MDNIVISTTNPVSIFRRRIWWIFLAIFSLQSTNVSARPIFLNPFLKHFLFDHGGDANFHPIPLGGQQLPPQLYFDQPPPSYLREYAPFSPYEPPSTTIETIASQPHHSIDFDIYFQAPQFQPNAPVGGPSFVDNANSHRKEEELAMVTLYVVPENKINVIKCGTVTEKKDQKPTGLPAPSTPKSPKPGFVEIKQPNEAVKNAIPAIRLTLTIPLIIYEREGSILFPSHITVKDEQRETEVGVSAIVVPVVSPVDAEKVSPTTPLRTNVVYVIPAQPLNVHFIELAAANISGLTFTPSANSTIKRPSTLGDYVNNEKDVVVDSEGQSVIVESITGEIPTKPPSTSVTITTESSPEDGDEELVNRNPPAIVPFNNPKESQVLNELREQSKKERL